MKISDLVLPEFDIEMANTRKSLERVPENRFDWKPHDKSMTLGRLASHLAEMPGWCKETIDKDELDLAPPGAPPYQPVIATSRHQLLDIFDQNVRSGRAAIVAASDELLMKNWTMRMGGRTIFTMPRFSVLRSFVLNHTIHHRAQLGVYLRLNDIPVPSVYGPSADEGGM